MEFSARSTCFGSTSPRRAHGRIVEQLGYARPHVFDRMIPAQALVAGASVATLNARDFLLIPDLNVEDWSTSPA
jgi:predicted nucleic acid-binding protein